MLHGAEQGGLALQKETEPEVISEITSGRPGADMQPQVTSATLPSEVLRDTAPVLEGLKVRPLLWGPALCVPYGYVATPQGHPLLSSHPILWLAGFLPRGHFCPLALVI